MNETSGVNWRSRMGMSPRQPHAASDCTTAPLPRRASVAGGVLLISIITVLLLVLGLLGGGTGG